MRNLVLACGVAVALLGAWAMEAAAQSSCGGWNAVCLKRCAAMGKTDCPTCRANLATCRKTGCWTEIAKFGGASHCNLKKS
jgi:hypothetical protein